VKLPARVAFAATLLLSVVVPTVCHASVRRDAPGAEVSVNVPYLPQTEALCGGAAAAMVFRYWGEAHASVQQFEPLVDRAAGGISDAALVAAIDSRGWTTATLTGSIEMLRSELAAHRPPIILIADRPQRYHYVVVVGLDARDVLVHDPTWGPARRIPVGTVLQTWKATRFWMLRVTPGLSGPAVQTVPSAAAAVADASSFVRGGGSSDPPSVLTACDVALDEALDDIGLQGLASADAALREVASRCPADARPWSELAGVRFAQQRWSESAALAREALARDGTSAYAADVLASSLFMMDDVEGALRAWNITGGPRLDSVQISGLTRTRYALVAEALALEPEATLSADQYRLARRRVASMPDLSSTRLSLRPGDAGFAVVDVAVVERPSLPRNAVQWSAAAARAGIDREVALRLPGRTGQGETWTASWRWWENRPAASLQFAAPRLATPRGVWRVGLSWDAQTYGSKVGSKDPTPRGDADAREERTRGEIGLASWMRPDLQVTLVAGLDGWRRLNGLNEKTISVGAEIERRLFADHVTARVAGQRWAGFGSPGFATASGRVSFASSVDPAPIALLAQAGAEIASASSPLALWSGAGEGRARGALLRAHPLLDHGRIDGPVFGQRLAHATVETQHWLRRPGLVRLGAAAFVDLAAASHRSPDSIGYPLQVDAGAGLRIRIPGISSSLRIDYARGLRDGAHAWTIGWQM